MLLSKKTKNQKAKVSLDDFNCTPKTFATSFCACKSVGMYFKRLEEEACHL